MQKFTEGIEKVYADLDGVNESQFTGLPSPPGASVPGAKVAWDKRNTTAQAQQIVDILFDMEADIESGDHTQQEIVDTVTNNIGGEDADIHLGAKVESAVENFFSQFLNLRNYPPVHTSRDAVAALKQNTDRTLNASAVPGKIEGQPWVHTDDDFILFLEWVIKQGDENDEAKYTARSPRPRVSSRS